MATGANRLLENPFAQVVQKRRRGVEAWRVFTS